MVAASAPGKLILMGEHGAVYGLPALTTALSLRVRVELEEVEDERVELDLPDLGVHQRTAWGEIRADTERARAGWQAFSGGGPFERAADPAAVVRLALGEATGALGSRDLPGLRLRVASELPVGAGFGSSAAVAVAVVAGLLAWRGVEPHPARVDAIALEVERRQHGRPSGIDHGTVLRGGVQWSERDAGGELRQRPVAARSELLAAFRVYDSGSPAESTGSVVAAVAERQAADPEAFDGVLTRMRSTTDGFREALDRGEADALAPAVTAFERCLERIGVVPEPVRRAVRRVEEAGGAAKISGAGSLSGAAAGCLLVHPPPPTAHWVEPAEWRKIDCEMGAPGMRVEAA